MQVRHNIAPQHYYLYLQYVHLLQHLYMLRMQAYDDTYIKAAMATNAERHVIMTVDRVLASSRTGSPPPTSPGSDGLGDGLVFGVTHWKQSCVINCPRI